MKQGVIFTYLRKHWLSYLLGVIMLAAVDYYNLIIPQITGQITDGLSAKILSMDMVWALIIDFLTMVIVVTIGRVLYRFFIFGSCRRVETEIRNDLFSKLETLSQNYFNANKTGDMMSNFTNDIDALRNAMGPAVVSSFDAVVMTLMTLYKMVSYVSLKLTLVTLIPMSIIACMSLYFCKEEEKRYYNKQKAFGKLSDMVQESYSGIRVIKAFIQEKKQDAYFELKNKDAYDANLKVTRLMAFFWPFLEFVIGVSYVITIVYGGYLAITGEITLGRFVAFCQYTNMLIWPMMALGDAINCFSQGLAASKRIKSIFDEEPEIKDDERTDYSIDSLNGDIEFSHLSFRYRKDLPLALADLNIKIKKGETLAILGITGSGKTTVVNLLTRLYSSEDNMIKLDGHNINSIPLKLLRESISYVPQDNYLFSDTIENNVKFGNLNASHDEVVEVCKQAEVHDNIIDFPEGYETMVGERGVTLSGGQKQRTSIARALLKKASILILDDSLSAVDTDTEDNILANLKKHHSDKTVIMIAHRVSTIRNADHILVLDKGETLEYGTFDELMALNGTFKAMYDKQQLEKQLAMQG